MVPCMMKEGLDVQNREGRAIKVVVILLEVLGMTKEDLGVQI